MLPTTGRFKNITCPFYETCLCERPYCHFKHVKKTNDSSNLISELVSKAVHKVLAGNVPPKTLQEGDNTTTNITYNPTPISELKKIKDVDEKFKNSPDQNLYTPEEQRPVCTTIDNNSLEVNDEKNSKFKINVGYSPTPISKQTTTVSYVPSSIKSLSSDTENKKFNLEYSPSRNSYTGEENPTDENLSKYSFNFIDDYLNDSTTTESKSSHSKKKEIEKKYSSKSSRKKDETSSKKRSSSSSSSSKSKHSSSNKKVSSSNKDHKNSDIKKDSNKSKGSSSSSSKHKSESTKSNKSSDKKHSDKKKSSSDKLKDDNKSKKKRKERDKEKSKNSDKDKNLNKNVSKPLLLEDEISSMMYDDDFMEFEESDDEMEQCKRIFEEYKPPENTTQLNSKQENKLEESSDPSNSITHISKKRVAHDKSSTVIRKPTIKPRNVKSAALVMENRYKIIKAKLLEKQQQLESQEKLINELQNSNATQKAPSIQTETTVSTSYPNYIPSKIKRIAHCSNVSSLLNAKNKINEIVKASSVPKTPQQTVSKGSKRVAHIPELSLADIPTVLQAEKSKLPINVRNKYLVLMAKETGKLYLSKDAAYDRALNEELNCYTKCSALVSYKNSAMLTINRLRKEAASLTTPHKSGFKPEENDYEGTKFYNNISKWVLSEQELEDNGFPRVSTKGCARFKLNKSLLRIPEQCQYCSRCKKIYRVNEFGFAMYPEDCVYHPASKYFTRGESRYACCKQVSASDGCCIYYSHVFEIQNPNELTGFMTTFEPDSEDDVRSKKVYALDCEMVYTTKGIELARVTVVDNKSQTVYESLVKPFGSIIDCNTRYSGLTEDMLKNVTTKITEVQAALLSMFNAKTILIGHSLESDLKALRLIHSCIIDTSVLFPHKMGPPKKRSLRVLASDFLLKIIQNEESGHDSAEDAITCMELIIWKLKEELKTK